MLKLIGLTGHKGAGKSLAAEYLRTKHGFACVGFASPLKAMLQNLGVPYANLHAPLLKEEPLSEFGGRSARYLMQSLGEWGREAAPDFWVERWKVTVQRHVSPLIVADDIRYPNEAKAVHQLGGKVIRIRRPSADNIIDDHPSEKLVDSISADFTIHNHIGPDQLKMTIDNLLAGDFK